MQDGNEITKRLRRTCFNGGNSPTAYHNRLQERMVMPKIEIAKYPFGMERPTRGYRRTLHRLEMLKEQLGLLEMEKDSPIDTVVYAINH